MIPGGPASSAAQTPPLDSRFRENDELGGEKEELRGENDDEGDFFASAPPLARIIDDC